MTIYTTPQDNSCMSNYMGSWSTGTFAGEFQSGNYNSGDSKRRGLINFPVLNNGTIPKNAQVVSAILYVYGETGYASNPGTHRIYRIKRNVVINQSSWVIYSTGNSWQTAGGFGVSDCEQTDIGVIANVPAGQGSSWRQISLSPVAIQEIISGVYPYATFLMKADTENNDLMTMGGSSTGATAPYIVITYTTGNLTPMWFA